MTDVPTTMTAAYVDELGPVSNIRYGELAVPAIGPTDVLVEVTAVVVDPVDTLVRSGAYRTPTPFPFVLGRDLVGTVVATGDGAIGFTDGDRVWANSLGHHGRQGTFAQYAAVAVDRLYHLPNEVDPIRAVAVAHPAATAFLGLFRHAGLPVGESIYVGGGAGNVGTAAIELAATAGARVIAAPGRTTSSTAVRPARRRWSTTATPTWASACAPQRRGGSASTGTPRGTTTSTSPPR